MERIKDALEQARRAREKALQENTGNTLRGTRDENVDVINGRRIRERVPFNQLDTDEQDRLIAAGEVLRFETGRQVFVSGELDEHVHYLLEGAVSITGENTAAQTLYAYQEAALLPLDEAGLKSHTVTTLIPSRIFRIAQSRLQAVRTGPTVRAAAPPGAPAQAEPPARSPATGDTAPAVTEPPQTAPAAAARAPVEEEEIPRELYAQTYSGEQLAQLVEALHSDRSALAPPGPAAAAAAAAGGEEVRFGESTLGLRLESLPPEVEAPPPAAEPPPSLLPSREEISDEIGRFMGELEARFRRYVVQVRADERRRAQAQLQLHVKRLQQLAERQLKAKLETIRERYQTAYGAREKRLRDRYDHLIVMANKLARQKAAIYQARRQLEDKLRLAEQVHLELTQIGLTVTRQLNDLEGLLPGEDETPNP